MKSPPPARLPLPFVAFLEEKPNGQSMMSLTDRGGTENRLTGVEQKTELQTGVEQKTEILIGVEQKTD